MQIYSTVLTTGFLTIVWMCRFMIWFCHADSQYGSAMQIYNTVLPYRFIANQGCLFKEGGDIMEEIVLANKNWQEFY
jgi:hypothetical protein